MHLKIGTVILVAVFPITVLFVQIVDTYMLYGALALLLISILIVKRGRRALSLLVCMICGYLVWNYAVIGFDAVFQRSFMNADWIVASSRLALIGYILPFVAYQFISKASTNYFRLGDFSAKIKMPFIWYGMNENVARICLVFSVICLVSASFFFFFGSVSINLLIVGIVFAIINSMLEELLWRGFILSRTVDLFGEKIGLVAMALSFGFYHFSLGFSIPICIIFSLGGIFFGGVAIRSKGLILPMIMHIVMNILFVSMGIIF